MRKPVITAAVAVLLSVTGPVLAASSQQRAAFKQAYAEARAGNPAWRGTASGLRDYVLYPWLEAVWLEHGLKTANPAAIERYLKRYQGLLPAQDLRSRYLRQLAKNKNWAQYLRFYKPGHGDTLTCYALKARIEQGQTITFERDLAPLWKDPSLPNACNDVQQWAHQHGLLTPQRLWARIDRAVDAGRGGTVAWLARWLPGTDRVQAEHLAQALRDPATAAKAAGGWADNVRNRRAAVLAMVGTARRDSSLADRLWPGIENRFRLSAPQRGQVQAAMALYVATDFSDVALKRLAALPAAAQTDATRAWRVRVALAKRNWRAALAALNALSADQKQEGEWRYWHARVLEKLGQRQQAYKLYQQQAKLATFYGFLAADRITAPYSICQTSPAVTSAGEQAVRGDVRFQRAFELHAVGMQSDARRVWNRALAKVNSATRQTAAYMAWQQGWYDRAIRVFSHGKLMHYYTQRYPLARQDNVVAQARDAGIDPAWAYAIIRAESAWQPDARSGADARGLMQLLPSTARLVARRQGIPYDGNLYDPRVNVALGTHYLAHVAARYDGAPYLATAAYNAGPGNVDRWVAERGYLPPDIFVATIPYHETRGYVMRVLAYSVIYDWRLHGTAVPVSKRLPPRGQAYQPPTASTPRKAVGCAP